MMVYEDILEWLDGNPKINDLRKKAKELGIRIKKRMKKREIMRVMREEIMRRMEGREERRSEATSRLERTYEEVSEVKPQVSKELPSTYGKDKLVLLAVNPNWLHAYWDFSPETLRLIESLQEGSQVVLRLHDVTYIIFDGSNANRTFEVGVDVRYTRNYYFNVPTPGADYLLELGYKTPDGRFVPIMRSNVCRAPKNSPSQSLRERWMDLRTKKKRVLVGEGSIVKPVERMGGSSAVNVSSGPSPSGGGAFIWERVRSGLGKGGI